MPVTITVSQIRDALYRADSGTTAGEEGGATTALLGQWFHECLGFLVSSDAPASPLDALSEVVADPEVWKATLAERAYAVFVGPRLTGRQALLHEAAPQVLQFWQAVQSACHWLAELSWAVKSGRPSRRASPPAPWQSLADVISSEEPLACEIREPGWSESVLLVGVADAVVRLAQTGAWCAIEFKSGRTSPEADLGQACLYHLLLSNAEQTFDGKPAETGTLALVSFRPQRHEQLFEAAELEAAKTRLMALIGKLAGVDTGAPAFPAGSVQPARPEQREAEAPHLELGQNLVRTLAEYGVDVDLGHPISAGAAFLRFPITMGRGTKVRAIERLAPELQVRLALKAEPFIDREDGRLVIDVQRPDRQTVYFDEVRAQLPAPNVERGSSRVPVGVDLSGELICADLATTEHAHLLVAGTTGSGKTEWLRLAIAGLILTNTPDTLRLLVIDPKRNAFHALRSSPFLWRRLVFPDEQSAPDVLEELTAEMDARYRKLDGADSIDQLAARSNQHLPRIVCVCDEYRDLISRSRAERKLIEAHICRLGAKARAAGIHLILATQQPSRDTIKGPLDSNIPARVGLKMGKSLESNMLLSEAGAEKLLGHGDLLFKDIGRPRRLQAPLLTEANRTAIFGGVE
jgi:DNA segregation ATPase FtsK/SpoIIIE, S-DNA-T family